MVTVLAIVCWPGHFGQADEIASAHAPTERADMLQQAFQQRCVKCHGKDGRVEGKVRLVELRSADDLMTQPAQVRKLIEAFDTRGMPPEEEPALDESVRAGLVERLRKVLHAAVPSRTELPRRIGSRPPKLYDGSLSTGSR